MKLFIDNNLPPGWAIALTALFGAHGNQIEHLRDRFARSTNDADWIKALGREGDWVVLSGDFRIAKQRLSRELFIGAGLIGFFFAPKSEKERAHLRFARLLQLWTSIEAHARDTQKGCFQLPPSGHKFRRIGG